LISAILKSFESQQWDRLLGKAVMFLFLLGKHGCLFGMVGLWWCLVQLFLPEKYGVVRAQYPEFPWEFCYLLVFVGFNSHN
jgi:hypothetical protein